MKFIKLIVDLHEEVYNNMVIKNEYTDMDVIAVHNALMDAAFMRSNFLDHERKFESIVVRYPSEESCIYPEYKGKPYFSIQYEEKGEHIVGFGTYNPDVLSRYLIEYFILPTIIKADDTTRDCKTCKHSNNGKCAGTEKCRDCIWDSKYEQQPNEDCISRQEVNTLVDELARAISDERCCMSRGRSTATIMKDILDLPPVTPQPKMGRWIERGRWIEKGGKEQGYDIAGTKTWYIQILCNKCGFIKTAIEGHTGQYKYCPQCGAKMQEVNTNDGNSN